MNKKILVFVAAAFFGSIATFAQMHHRQMLEFVSVCEKLADECSLGNKISCSKLKQHARIMRDNINRMTTTDSEQMADSSVMEEIKKADPDLAQRMSALKSKNPSKFKKAVRVSQERHLCIKPQMIKPGSKDIIKIVDLNLKEDEIIQKYKFAKSDKERNSLKEELKDILSRKFDIKTNHIKTKIKTAEEQLDIDKENLKNRKRNKKKRLENQINQFF